MKTEKQQGHITDMTRRNSLKVIIRFVLPLVAAVIIQQLFSLADAMVLGIFNGNRRLAVLGVYSRPVWFQVGILTDFGQVSCLLTAARSGIEDETNLKKAIGNVYFAPFLLGPVMAPELLGPAGTLLHIQNTPPEVFDDILSYLRILYIGTILLLVYNTLSPLLRTLGDSYASFLAITVSTLVSVAMNIILVAGSGVGVRRATIVTTASQVLVALICLAKISRYSVLHIRGKYLRLDGLLLEEYIGTCTPMMAQSIVITVGGTFVRSHANQHKTVFAAGVSATGGIFNAVETETVALVPASTSFASQNVGARRFERMRTVIKWVYGLSEVTAVIIAIVLLLSGRCILSFYVTNEAAVYTTGNLKMCNTGLLLTYPIYALRRTAQALGNIRIPLLAAVLQPVVRILAANFLPMLIGNPGTYFINFAVRAVSLILVGFVYPVQLRKCMENSRGGEIS